LSNGPMSRGRCRHGLTRGKRGLTFTGTAAHQLKSAEERRDVEPHKVFVKSAENCLRNVDEKKMLPAKEASENNLVAVIDAGKCIVCGICEGLCPWGAITVSLMVDIDISKCTECGKCVSECPYGAITITRV
jgi:ferredoxin